MTKGILEDGPGTEIPAMSARREPWSDGDIARFVENTLRDRSGTWVMGVPGAIGEFTIDAGENVDIASRQGIVQAATPRAAIRFQIDGWTAAFSISREKGGEVTVLAVERRHLFLPVHQGMTALGKDRAAIRPDDRGEDLFDIGLGRAVARFDVRVPPGPLRDRLEDAEGSDVFAFLSQQGSAILADSPTRVVETALGRMEISTPIPPPGGTSPSGPHTHLLPGHIARNLDRPPELDMPEDLAVGAIFYPAASD